MASDLIVETPDGRFYKIGDRLYVSVTNVIDTLAQLADWAAWETSGAAFDRLPELVAAMITPSCGRPRAGHASHSFGHECTSLCPCGRCQECVRYQLSRTHHQISSRRAKEGGDTHDYVENWVLSDGRVRIKVRAEVQPYVDAFHAFCDAYGLTPDSWVMVEAVAFNPELDYAGTTDGAVIFEAEKSEMAAALVASVLNVSISGAMHAKLRVCVLIDTKTKEKPLPPGRGAQLYPSHALQLGAYYACPKVQIKGTSVFTTMPALDGAVLVQLRPPTDVDAGFTARPVDVGPKTLKAFLAQQEVVRWLREDGTAAVSSRTFKPAKPEKIVKPRKAPAKKINPAPTPERTAATVARDIKPRKSTAAFLSTAGQPGLRDDEIPF